MKSKIIKNTLLAVLVFMFQAVEILAENQPPAPRGAGGFDDGVVVGGQIDNYLLMLFFVALVFGVWAISKKEKLKIS